MSESSQRRWRSPDPTCLFVVACAGDRPRILEIVNPEGNGGAIRGHVSRAGPAKQKPLEQPVEIDDTFGVITPDRGLIVIGVAGKTPPLPVMNHPGEWEGAGLNAELAGRFKSSHFTFMIQVTDPGSSIVRGVTFATLLADRASIVAKGCVDDFNAQRFFGDGSWTKEASLDDSDLAAHVSIHVQPSSPKGLWVHTHGLIKFGRAEIEMRAVPPELLERGLQTIGNFADYVVQEKEIRPGDTVGNPDSPLIARISYPDPSHWEGAPALELVDVDRSRNPVPIGVERGLRAMIWA